MENEDTILKMIWDDKGKAIPSPVPEWVLNKYKSFPTSATVPLFFYFIKHLYTTL